MENLYQPGPIPNPQLKLNLASPLKRLLAKILDYMIIIWPMILTVIIFGGGYENDGLMIVEGMYILGIGIVNMVLLSIYGQTIAKKIVGIRVVKMGTWDNGGFVTNVLLREFVSNLISSFTCSVFTIVDSLFIFRTDRRCVHDLIASTCVVNMGNVFISDEYNHNNGF